MHAHSRFCPPASKRTHTHTRRAPPKNTPAVLVYNCVSFPQVVVFAEEDGGGWCFLLSHGCQGCLQQNEPEHFRMAVHSGRAQGRHHGFLRPGKDTEIVAQTSSALCPLVFEGFSFLGPPGSALLPFLFWGRVPLLN